MPRTVRYSIAYDSGETVVDLCKIIFGGDGSYFVTAPYHPHDRAITGILTVNYTNTEDIALTDAVELAVLDDDDRRLKLSHHPDGFLQFSGEGVRSGRDQAGDAKGIGVRSWPLYQPALGPSFGLSFTDPLACGRPVPNNQGDAGRLTLHELDIAHMRPDGMNGLLLTGYYFPMRWREFLLRGADGGLLMPLVHPKAQAVKHLRVVLASKESTFPGFIGFECSPHTVETDGSSPGFFMSSSTGNLRRNEKGELLGDMLMCMYPSMSFESASLPSLNYALDDPPYTAPTGSAP